VLWWESGPRGGQRVAIEATRLAGPRGKLDVWTKNPIPALDCPSGGAPDYFAGGAFNCTGPQFPPPIEDPLYWGFSSYNITNTHEQTGWLPFIADFVVVPEVAKEGHYVLSWRWDSEQTPQVWNSCADIYISKSNSDVYV